MLPCPTPLVLRNLRVPARITTTTAADFCSIMREITFAHAANAPVGFGGIARAFRLGPQSDSHSDHQPPVAQIAPDKNMNYHDTTAGFTVPRGFMAFVVWCPLDPAAQPGIQFLCVGSSFCTPASSGQSLAVLPLPSASLYYRQQGRL